MSDRHSDGESQNPKPAIDCDTGLNLANLCKDTVRIEGYDKKHPNFGDGYQSSGTVMSKDGLIVTADHGLTEAGVNRYDIQFSDGEHRSAHLFARNEKLGLAVFRLNNDQTAPQPYYPLKFAGPNSNTPYSPTIAYGYMGHSTDMENLTGIVGQQKMIDNVSEDVLRESAPNIDRHMMAEDVRMNAGQGFSGAAPADAKTAEILGVVQFGIGKVVQQADSESTVKMSDESLLTPAYKVKEYLESLSTPEQKSHGAKEQE